VSYIVSRYELSMFFKYNKPNTHSIAGTVLIENVYFKITQLQKNYS